MARRRLAHDERSAAILRVARELFSRRPYSAVPVGDLAEAAGVSPALILFYFGSKKALYLEVLRTAITALAEGLDAVPGPPSLARLRASARFYAEQALTHRTGYLSLLRSGGDPSLPEAVELVEGYRETIVAKILADVAADVPPLDDATRLLLGIGIRGYLGFVDAAIVPWLDLPDDQRALVDPDAIAELALGAFRGILTAVLPTLSHLDG